MLFPVDKKLVSTSGMKDWPKNIFQLRNELFLQAVDRHLRKWKKVGFTTQKVSYIS